MKTQWYIRDGAWKFLTIGAINSRGPLLVGWVPDRKTAEPFDKWEHARDFLAWSKLSDADQYAHIVDYVEAEPIPPDADKTPVRTAAQVRAEALDDDRKKYAVRAANWKIAPRHVSVAQ